MEIHEGIKIQNSKFKIQNGLSRASYFLLILFLFLLPFLERIAFDLGPNFEFVTAAMVLSSYYLGKKESFWITLTIVVSTDLIIGNSNIFLFTWSGFLIPVMLSGLLKKLTTNNPQPTTKRVANCLCLSAFGVASNIFFFLWTNFGVWLLDSWEMYPNNLWGLLASYVNALPFLKNQITSTLTFIPLGFVLIESAMSLAKKYISKEETNIALNTNQV